jgi:signal transduction histidine kinase
MELVLDFSRAASADGDTIREGPAGRLLESLRYALAHDLPNQLLAVQGLARLVLEEQGERLDPAGRELLERLAAAARRADELTRSLADLARLVRLAGHEEEVAPALVVREAAAGVNLFFPELAIEYHVEDGLPTLRVSRFALYQLLVQLLRAAARTARPGTLLHVEVGAASTPEGIGFWVADDGAGLGPDQVQQLRDLAPGGRGMTTGNELGLVLVCQVVAGWGGSLRVRSSPDEGTRFTVRVPDHRERTEGDRP